MSNISELISRTDRILTKYDKYDANKALERRIAGSRNKSGDPFMDEWLRVMDDIQALALKSEEVAQEKNRAQKAAMNAEIRRGKAHLRENSIPHLQQLIHTKGATQDLIDDRLSKLDEINDAVDDIVDGTAASMRRPTRLMSTTTNGAGPSRTLGNIQINSSGLGSSQLSSEQYKEMYTHTEETQAFQGEWDEAKVQQDERLERIETGLGTLKDLGVAMGEEIERHDVLIDEVDAKMDSVTTDLKNNNAKLKGLVTKVASSRNFFIDVILIVILLALGLYIYNMVS